MRRVTNWLKAAGATLLLGLILGGCIMPHGYPPWSGIKKETVFALPIDMAELAARLGSIVTYDRRGDVVWLEDFESGLTRHWRTNGDYTGTPAISTSAARNGAYSVKLETAALSGSGCGIIHHHPLPVESKIGLEASFSIEQNVGSIEFRLELYDGDDYTYAALKYLPGSDKWQYLNSAGGWTDLFTSVALIEYPQAFHTVKFVVDYETDEYVRALADEQAKGLADISAQTGTVPTTPFLALYITVINDDTNVAIAYVDDVIITQSEP